jgi:hypothetical protein
MNDVAFTSTASSVSGALRFSASTGATGAAESVVAGAAATSSTVLIYSIHRGKLTRQHSISKELMLTLDSTEVIEKPAHVDHMAIVMAFRASR